MFLSPKYSASSSEWLILAAPSRKDVLHEQRVTYFQKKVPLYSLYLVKSFMTLYLYIFVHYCNFRYTSYLCYRFSFLSEISCLNSI